MIDCLITKDGYQLPFSAVHNLYQRQKGESDIKEELIATIHGTHQWLLSEDDFVFYLLPNAGAIFENNEDLNGLLAKRWLPQRANLTIFEENQPGNQMAPLARKSDTY